MVEGAVRYCHPSFGCDCGDVIEQLEEGVRNLTRLYVEQNELLAKTQEELRQARMQALMSSDLDYGAFKSWLPASFAGG